MYLRIHMKVPANQFERTTGPQTSKQAQANRAPSRPLMSTSPRLVEAGRTAGRHRRRFLGQAVLTEGHALPAACRRSVHHGAKPGRQRHPLGIQ